MINKINSSSAKDDLQDHSFPIRQGAEGKKEEGERREGERQGRKTKKRGGQDDMQEKGWLSTSFQIHF